MPIMPIMLLYLLPYIYYEFAVQNWANATYQIHGLWPAYSHSKYPSWCNGTEYKNVTGAQYDDMQRYWNSDDDNQAFWGHEWTKHGTCMQQQTNITQDQYFDTALDIFKSLISENTTWACGATDDCIVACYDLMLKNESCPTK